MPTAIKNLQEIVNSSLTKNIKKSEIIFNQLSIEVNPEDIISTILFLKTNERCKFKQLIDLTAVDYPEREKRFKIVYLLLSIENNLRMIINTHIKENSLISTISKIFPSANWMEREVFDMYGISFKDHPDLRRILTDYGFKGYPLRKDFPLTGHSEVRYSEENKKVIYEPVKLEQAYRDFDFESPWEGTKYIKQEETKNNSEKNISKEKK